MPKPKATKPKKTKLPSEEEIGLMLQEMSDSLEDLSDEQIVAMHEAMYDAKKV